MASIVIPDIQESTLARLNERASAHGRTPEEEARAMLEESLRAVGESVWDRIDAFRSRLASSGRSFSDSAELIREDRDR